MRVVSMFGRASGPGRGEARRSRRGLTSWIAQPPEIDQEDLRILPKAKRSVRGPQGMLVCIQDPRMAQRTSIACILMKPYAQSCRRSRIRYDIHNRRTLQFVGLHGYSSWPSRARRPWHVRPNTLSAYQSACSLHIMRSAKTTHGLGLGR
jgi:hypothetical protein